MEAEGERYVKMSTRRHFLKQSARGSAAFALLPPGTGILLEETETVERRLERWLRAFGAKSPAARVAPSGCDGRPTFRVRLSSPREMQCAHDILYDHFDLAIARPGNILELHSAGVCVVVQLGGSRSTV